MKKSLSFFNNFQPLKQNTKEFSVAVPKLVQHFFATKGNTHLLYLMQVRKLWNEKVDSFLSHHSYPRNFALYKELQLSLPSLEQSPQSASLSFELNSRIATLQKQTFSKEEKIWKKVEALLKRKLTFSEKQTLQSLVTVRKRELTLHLTVYDGGFAQAILLEMPNYIDHLQTIFPHIPLMRLQTHIGNLADIQQDQKYVQQMQEKWTQLIPTELRDICFPAYIHRLSATEATLVLYVSKPVQNSAIRQGIHYKYQILNQIHDHFPTLKHHLSQVAFSEKDPSIVEATRVQAFVQSSIEHNVAPTHLQQLEPLSTVDEKDSTNILTIIERLRKQESTE